MKFFRDPVAVAGYMAVASVAVCVFKVLVAGMTLTLGALSLSGGTIDGGVVAAILTPTLGAFIAGHHSDNVTKRDKGEDA